MDEEVRVLEEEEDVPTVIEEESSASEDDVLLPDSAQGDEPSIASVGIVNDDDDQVVEPEPQPMAEEPDRRLPAVQKLNSHFGGFWNDSLIG